jgi:hypothetical protein
LELTRPTQGTVHFSQNISKRRVAGRERKKKNGFKDGRAAGFGHRDMFTHFINALVAGWISILERVSSTESILSMKITQGVNLRAMENSA